jgi:hypothetical protein
MVRRGIAALAIAAAAVVAAPAGASAATSAQAQAQAAPLAGDVRVDFTTYRFVKRSGRLVARGRVVATYTSAAGAVTRVAKPTTARVIVARRVLQGGGGRTCSVLRLVLGPVNLNLLGLEVDLRAANGGPIILSITANRRGGILGQLLCSLSRGDILGRNASATARRLNRQMLGSEGMSTAGFGAPLEVATAQVQQVTCPILNLVLGPLDLRVLGLRVHLNRIRLRITAHQGGGILGDLLCGLSVPVPPTTPPPPPAPPGTG